ncbi:hypothetical protein [Methylobacterium oxalidis]|uniref:hypothetical protein n=1 Tax=Methylobacterium oxalidis TaxID=944322 RepID=UPI0011BEB2BF|nr:hypothetical protein [Methylobacterium oxalidis]GJE31169.1 hypothetical protein LDDCCGHA_1345 [Methylobacterium oxalidis]
MNTYVTGAAQPPPVEAEIFLRNWPRSYECKAVLTNKDRALIATNLARDLPEWFSLAMEPDFKPRPCTVSWRGQRTLEVMLFE